MVRGRKLPGPDRTGFQLVAGFLGWFREFATGLFAVAPDNVRRDSVIRVSC